MTSIKNNCSDCYHCNEEDRRCLVLFELQPWKGTRNYLFYRIRTESKDIIKYYKQIYPFWKRFGQFDPIRMITEKFQLNENGDCKYYIIGT